MHNYPSKGLSKTKVLSYKIKMSLPVIDTLNTFRYVYNVIN